MAVLNNSIVIVTAAGLGFLVAYRLYGRFIARRVLGFDPARETPAHRRRDGIDYVPAHPAVLFGHHFASIAGLAPIVGPAIAVLWGWAPALLWVVLGAVFVGAVHDLSTLYASLRHDGRFIGDLTFDILGPRARVLFLLIIFFLLALAMGVFALLMAQLFTDLSPQAVIPTFSLIVIAVIIGLLVYWRRWHLGVATLIGLVLMFTTLFAGMKVPIPLYKLYLSDETRRVIAAEPHTQPLSGAVSADCPGPAERHFAEQAKYDPRYGALAEDVAAAARKAKDSWTYMLLGYALIASILPVWLLLQPRDYINSYQLYIGVAVMLLGLIVWNPPIIAPAVQEAKCEMVPIWPFLFITIACGAVSGFHNLVSSGTTARQIRNERDATVVGYGAMLMESFLAVLVILACCAGLGDRYHEIYDSGFTSKLALGAFLEGAGNVIAQPFLWVARVSRFDEASITVFTKSFIAVVVVGFAMTTLDSGTRLLRFNVETIGKVARLRPLQNRYVASVLAVMAIGGVALLKINGQAAGLALWQLFGTTNQLLAAIGLLVVSVMLFAMGKPIIYTLAPFATMLVIVMWAMVYKLRDFYCDWRDTGDTGNATLFCVGAAILVLSLWMLVEAVIVFARQRRIRKQQT